MENQQLIASEDKKLETRKFGIGWVIMGIPFTIAFYIFMTVNYSLLELGLEAILGNNKFTFRFGDYALLENKRLNEVIALFILLAECLLGYFIIEFADSKPLLGMKNRFSSKTIKFFIFLFTLFFFLIVLAEVYVGIFRQGKIEPNSTTLTYIFTGVIHFIVPCVMTILGFLIVPLFIFILGVVIFITISIPVKCVEIILHIVNLLIQLWLENYRKILQKVLSILAIPGYVITTIVYFLVTLFIRK